MKVFGDDECLTTINILKEPIKGYQHYNISDNELDNKVDWQGTSYIPSDTAISDLYWPGYILPAYKNVCSHANKKLNEGHPPPPAHVPASQEKPRVAVETYVTESQHTRTVLLCSRPCTLKQSCICMYLCMYIS